MSLRARRWQPGQPRQPQGQNGIPGGGPQRRRATRLPWWAVFSLIALAVWQYVEWKKPAAPAGGDTVAGTARVVDGDSLEIGNTRVRLFGIDAPEGRQLCRDARGEDYTCGIAARRALAALTDNKTVSCKPADAQSYDRLVAICTVSNQENREGKQHPQDLSEAMIRGGHAIELKSRSKGRYAAAERSARESSRGLWAGQFERPSQWRQRNGR